MPAALALVSFCHYFERWLLWGRVSESLMHDPPPLSKNKEAYHTYVSMPSGLSTAFLPSSPCGVLTASAARVNSSTSLLPAARRIQHGPCLPAALSVGCVAYAMGLRPAAQPLAAPRQAPARFRTLQVPVSAAAQVAAQPAKALAQAHW